MPSVPAAVISLAIRLICTASVAAQDPNCRLQRLPSGISQYVCDPVYGVPSNNGDGGQPPYLVYIGEPPFEADSRLGQCQGRCVMDSDCADGLTCRQRDPYREPVSCLGNHLLQFMNYCLAEDITGELTIEKEGGEFPLRRCYGGCLSNADCQGGLECWISEAKVPGCSGEQDTDVNYCYDPNDEFTEAGGGESSMGVLEYVGEPPFTTTLQECQGDCDSDWNCDFGLNCYKRADDRFVPGCMGAGIFSVDYCYVPDPGFLVIVRDDIKGTGAAIAGRCEGSCSTDDDCADGLRCLVRLNYEGVPGCLGVGAQATNYCYDPSDTIIVTDPPAESPLDAPVSVPVNLVPSTPIQSPDASTAETESPTKHPSVSPSAGPVVALSSVPSANPVSLPSSQPSSHPSAGPTSVPTVGPSVIPTTVPTLGPTVAPSHTPVFTPSTSPTLVLSAAPSVKPTPNPSTGPSVAPVFAPTDFPINLDGNTNRDIPTGKPQDEITKNATTTNSPITSSPSNLPSKGPTTSPTKAPSQAPITNYPSNLPSQAATKVPSVLPFTSPTDLPGNVDGNTNRDLPSLSPSVHAEGTSVPSLAHSEAPSSIPSQIPTFIGSQSPSISFVPSGAPTLAPTYQCSLSPIERAQQIGLILLPLSGLEVFGIAESPQSLAYNWIVDQDTLLLCPEDPRLTERYILAVLSFAIASENWSRCSADNSTVCDDALYLSGADYCKWDGIGCNPDGNVTTIRLDGLGLEGSLPAEIGFLKHLVEIDMDSNGLTGFIPGSFGQLESLEILDLDNNDLNGTIPDSIYGLSALRVIDLDGNVFSGTLSTELGSLTQLYFLQLDFNLFVGSIPAQLESLGSLKYLSLFGNQFTGEIPSPFCNATTIDRTIYANCDVCPDASCCTACLSV